MFPLPLPLPPVALPLIVKSVAHRASDGSKLADRRLMCAAQRALLLLRSMFRHASLVPPIMLDESHVGIQNLRGFPFPSQLPDLVSWAGRR